ncbi:MAG: pantothenate kinase [Oscillospiraceae bacterium]|nr:pantothenate kinase [Oscillospiraceae bacterium]
MSIILGIDIGGSSTKIVGLGSDGNLMSMLRVRAEDQLTSIYGALGNYLSTNSIALGDVEKIMITGVGSDYVSDNIYGIPVVKIDEFTSVGRGAQYLSGKKEAVVVSMGTGTALVHAKGQEITHMGGSGVGGGTIGGLCDKIFGVHRFADLRKYIDKGDCTKVDLTIADMSRGEIDTLHPKMTAANLANVSGDSTDADMAAGIVNMVLQTIGTLAVFACSSCGSRTVVLTGALTTLNQAAPNFALFSELYGIDFIIPENATFATCIGAALEGR